MAESSEVRIELDLLSVSRVAQWALLAVACVLALIGLGGQDPGHPYLILGCFAGIVSRIAQAERHHLEDRK